MPPLDLPRLRRDLKRRLAARPEGTGAGGRAITGSMAIVRAHLEDFERMHREGASWVDIAAALAVQGIRQGQGEAAGPITGRRLTALMASVRRERARDERAGRVRRSRPDLGAPDPSEAAASKAAAPGSASAGGEPRPQTRPSALSLAPDLSPELAPPELDPRSPEPAPPSAEDIRRAALAGVRTLLKKDPR